MDIEALAVDANILVAAMMGGKTRDLIVRLASIPIDLQSAEETFIEVEDHIIDLAGFTRARIDAFRLALASVPVRRVSRISYRHELERAKALMNRDPDDAPLVALALAKRITVWSNDKDFKALKEIDVITTRDLVLMYP